MSLDGIICLEKLSDSNEIEIISKTGQLVHILYRPMCVSVPGDSEWCRYCAAMRRSVPLCPTVVSVTRCQHQTGVFVIVHCCFISSLSSPPVVATTRRVTGRRRQSTGCLSFAATSSNVSHECRLWFGRLSLKTV